MGDANGALLCRESTVLTGVDGASLDCVLVLVQLMLELRQRIRIILVKTVGGNGGGCDDHYHHR